MKKVVFVIFASVILLCSCSKNTQSDYLEFPKTKWGMSMAETLDAYGISEKDTCYYDEDYIFGLEGYQIFGEKTSIIFFNYIYFEKGKNKLCNIEVNYPESADMNNVLKEIKKAYGETVSEVTNYSSYQIFEGRIPKREFSESDHLKCWANKKSVSQSIPENQLADYCNVWKNYQSGLNDDNWDTFSQNAKLVTLVWSDNGEAPSPEDNAVDFNAYNLVVFDEIKSQLSDQQKKDEN